MIKTMLIAASTLGLVLGATQLAGCGACREWCDEDRYQLRHSGGERRLPLPAAPWAPLSAPLSAPPPQLLIR